MFDNVLTRGRLRIISSIATDFVVVSFLAAVAAILSREWVLLIRYLVTVIISLLAADWAEYNLDQES